MILSVVVLSVNLGVDSPILDPSSAKKQVLESVYWLVAIVFLLELILESIAYGLIFSPTSFLRSSLWNLVNFITTIASVIFVINPWKRSNYLLKYLVILRISLLLRYLGKYVKEIRFAGKMVYKCLPRMMRLFFLAVIYLLMSGVLATKLMKGSLHKCSFQGEKKVEGELSTMEDCMDLGGDWTNPELNFDNIVNSL